MEIIFTFSSTHDAIAAEYALTNIALPVKVMPLPGKISAGCGICLRTSPALEADVIHFLIKNNLKFSARYKAENRVYSNHKPFTDAFSIYPSDVVSIIGCGGKTSLLHLLADENRRDKVLLSTTTHIKMPDSSRFDYDLTKSKDIKLGINLLYGEKEDEKLTAASFDEIENYSKNADYTFLECDGSKNLPLKGWNENEPQIPNFTNITIGVCTVKNIGSALSDKIIHRPEIFFPLTNSSPDELLTHLHLAKMLCSQNGMFQKAVGKKILFINQVESQEELYNAQKLIDTIKASSLQNKSDNFIIGSIHQNKIYEVSL